MSNKSSPKTVEQDATRELTPKLRFPEFRDAGGWKRRKLSDLLFEAKQRNRQLKYGPSEVLSVSGEHGCVNQIDLLGRSYAGVSVKDYHVVETGDIVYTKSPLKKNPYGIIKANKGKPGIVSTLYAVYRATDMCHPNYLDHYFSRDHTLNRYLQPIVRKGAKNDMKVNNAAVLSGEIWAPKLEEQQKLTNCLTSLDELITFHGQKLNVLKTYRKGLMQQLFPREGETIPRLRFPEFQGSPEWISDSLGNIFETSSGGTPERSVKEYWNGTIPWITTSLVDFNVIGNSDEFISEIGLEHSSAKVFPQETVLIAMYGQGKTRGKVALLGIEATTNQACAAILPRRDIDPYFVFLNLAGRYDEMRALSNSGGQENLSQGLIKGLPFSYPSDIAEQQKLSACLSSFDELITAQAQRLNTLKTHKNGLMQQLFAFPEEAEA